MAPEKTMADGPAWGTRGWRAVLGRPLWVLPAGAGMGVVLGMTVWAGGAGNLATGFAATANGGISNTVSGFCATASGGSSNRVPGEAASVSGGRG